MTLPKLNEYLCFEFSIIKFDGDGERINLAIFVHLTQSSFRI